MNKQTTIMLVGGPMDGAEVQIEYRHLDALTYQLPFRGANGKVRVLRYRRVPEKGWNENGVRWVHDAG